MSSMNSLFEQFKKSQGYDFIETNNEIMEEFISWVSVQKEMGKKYGKLLKDLGLSFDKKECAEVGKGKYDSVAAQYKTTIITPDEDIKPKGMFINTGFKVYNGMPTIISQVTSKKVVFGEINTNIINTFMTQNPYELGLLDNWNELPDHNTDIIVGIYGNKKDKNLKDKINLLQTFKERLCKHYINEKTTFNDTYCEVVATNQKVKRIGV